MEMYVYADNDYMAKKRANDLRLSIENRRHSQNVEVKDIGEHLRTIYEEDFDNSKPYRGEKFHEIVEYHLPTWLQIVVAMLENGEVKRGEISFKKDIEKRLSTEMLGKKKIQWRKRTLDKILKEYKYKGSWSLGTIESGDRGRLVLVVNPDLLDHLGFFEEDDEDLL